MIVAMLLLFALTNVANAQRQCICERHVSTGELIRTIWYQSSLSQCDDYLYGVPIVFYTGTTYLYDANGMLMGWQDFYNQGDLWFWCGTLGM